MAELPIRTFEPPVPPSNFTVVETEYIPGSYVVGHDQFDLATFPLANIFQRELTTSDDFLLGILSVILIGVLSDLVFTILLRTTANRVSPSGLFTAFMVDEATHFRNVLRVVRRGPRAAIRSEQAVLPAPARDYDAGPDPATTPRKSLAPALLSILVLTVLVALFVADVLVVVVTQPRKIVSTKHAYNLRAIHPSRTNIGLASYIRRLALERPCVAPVMTNGSSTQTRRFHLNVCLGFERSISTAARMDQGPDVAPRINVTSLFHVGGVDHNVSFPSGWLAVSIRVQLMADGELQGVRYLKFDSADDAAMSHARHLHNLFIVDAKQFSCIRNYDPAWCASRAKNRTAAVAHRTLERTVVTWNGRNSQTKVRARVLQSLFDEDLPRAYRSLDRATRVLITSAAVRETVGPGAYVNTRTDEDEDGIAGLLEEHSRMAGVVLLALLTVTAVTAMLAMRVWLKPTSLSELAAQGVDCVAACAPDPVYGAASDTYPGLASEPPSLDRFPPPPLPTPCMQCGHTTRPQLPQFTRRGAERREDELGGGASFLI